ncbi:XF1762 family protein [Streptomyces nanshensis]|uniref:XF1762 family protein n=1 Tax=Streptomyces nanshensis TaxID=518642 RepID=UPI0030B819B8
MSFREACAYVDRVHRHHDRPQGHKFSLGVMADGRLVGVAIIGRPVARAYDTGVTVEVTRVATDGTPNSCSALYGAAWRTARAAGYRRAITYTQEGESGASLRAAGWRQVAQRPARAGWDAPSRPRRSKGTDHVARVLWEITARQAPPRMGDETRDETRRTSGRRRCAAPSCRNRLIRRATGRPPRYCSPACRQRAYRRRTRARARSGRSGDLTNCHVLPSDRSEVKVTAMSAEAGSDHVRDEAASAVQSIDDGAYRGRPDKGNRVVQGAGLEPARDPGHGAGDACLQVAKQASVLAARAADEAMYAAARSRAGETARLDAVMLAAHEQATEAERLARLAAKNAGIGDGSTARALALRAVSHAALAQQTAGIEETAAELATSLVRQRSALERRAERDAAAETEAELRAATGMDEHNRVQLDVARSTAVDAVPALGWSRGHLRAMEAADAGRLYRRDGRAWDGGTPGRWDGGRPVARERVLMLASAGFLAICRGKDRRIIVTPMGSLALYLARLYPDGVFADDKAAYAARLAACRRPWSRKDELKEAARRLRPLDEHTLRTFTWPVTIAEQEAQAAELAHGAWEDDGGAVPEIARAKAGPRGPTPSRHQDAARYGAGPQEQLALWTRETVTGEAQPGRGVGPLVVVPCSARKLDRPAPVRHLYTGPLHTKARMAAEALTARGGLVLVLSGRRLIFRLDEVVEPYDVVMPERLTDQDVAQLRAEAVRHGVADADDVVLLTPRLYTSAARHIWPHATAALEGSGGIGVMLRRLAEISGTGHLGQRVDGQRRTDRSRAALGG